ncbi:MAG: S9 family peptidase [Tannerella sp.]|jgi:oligopeptidase B|nr:S9 family peptidase [Tannerella sp.]
MKKMIFMLAAVSMCGCRQTVEPPVAKVIPYTFSERGKARVDNYQWIRLSDAQKTAAVPDAHTQDVLNYLHAENAYREAETAHTDNLRTQLFEEMKARTEPHETSAPAPSNGYLYWQTFEEGKEYPVYYRRRDREGAADEVLLDVNMLAEGRAYCQTGRPVISPDNSRMAYAVDFVGRRNYAIHFVDLATGNLLEAPVADTAGDMVWANDSKTVFYTTKEPGRLRNYRVYRHKIGDADNTLCYEESDPTFNMQLGKTQSKKYITITSRQTLTNETQILDADRPDGTFVTFSPRAHGHLYDIDHIGRSFYIRSNRNALNFKLMKTTGDATAETRWTEVIPHRTDVLLGSFVLFDEHLAVAEQKNGLPHIRIVDLKDGSEQSVPFAEEVYTASFAGNDVPESDELRYNYSSLTTPNSVCTYNMRTKKITLLKETTVLGGFDKHNYESRRLWATAGDGTQVPISIVYRKGFRQDGGARLLLYSYGAYGTSSAPSFNPYILSLLDRGFAYAIAHTRGGSEMGREWYENGKLLKKINTFTDFNDCARHLIREKYTSPSTLYATGRSAGGLLMGAIANMEPQLYKAIVAGVPFVDIVSTMLDETIPLTTFEWDEWGNPAEKTYYDYMLSYSPYDRVKAQHYPHMLVTASFWDSQVQYWEPVKWVAKLRATKTDRNKLYLYCNMNAGHGGASGRFEQMKTRAMEYAFLLSVE